MNIYIVNDLNNAERVGVYKCRISAREALVNFLKRECGYTDREWEEFAHSAGYSEVEDFQDAMLCMDDYDEDMLMEVEEVELWD